MRPIEFDGQTTIIGKDQPQYNPLPARVTPEGVVLTCWEFTEEEISVIKITGKMYIAQHTFNRTLQPLQAFVIPAS